jgi:hypothetical protein
MKYLAALFLISNLHAPSFAAEAKMTIGLTGKIISLNPKKLPNIDFYATVPTPSAWLRMRVSTVTPEKFKAIKEGQIVQFGVDEKTIFLGSKPMDVIGQTVSFTLGWNAAKKQVVSFEVAPKGNWDEDQVTAFQKEADGSYRVKFAKHAQVYVLNANNPKLARIARAAEQSIASRIQLQVLLIGNTVVDMKNPAEPEETPTPVVTPTPSPTPTASSNVTPTPKPTGTPRPK